MNLSTEIIPLFLLATFGFLMWGLLRASKQGKAAVLRWLQSLLLVLPWLLWFGLFSLRVSIGFAGFVALLLVGTGLYVAVGHWIRDREEQVAPSNESSRGSASERVDHRLSTLEGAEGIFGVDSFFVTETIPYGEGAIFRGNLRMDPAVAVQTLTRRLEQQVGDGFRLFLVEDSQEKPAVVILPNAVVDQRSGSGAKFLALGLFVTTLFCLLEVGANLNGFRLLEDPARWLQAVPVGGGILTILVAHEVGHRWLASRYGVRLSPAFLVPSLGIGTLGSLNRIESPVPTRKALFDIAAAGPAAGGLLALVALVVGLWLSPGDIFLPADIFRTSILVGGAARWLLGREFVSEVIAIHPLVVVGWIGLGVTALGLLPAGQLDGGRMVQAVYGRKMAGRATFVSLILLAVAALSNVLALYWALLILFIAREPERPPLNEITETDGWRDALVLAMLLLMALTLLPIPPLLATMWRFPAGEIL